MLVYQTLDHFDEKQRLKGVTGKAPTEPTYQGLLTEAYIGQYLLHVYGYISNTNYKYVIVKNEGKTSPLGQRPPDDQIKNVSIISSRHQLDVQEPA